MENKIGGKMKRYKLKKNWLGILLEEIFLGAAILVASAAVIFALFLIVPGEEDSEDVLRCKENVRIAEQNHEKFNS